MYIIFEGVDNTGKSTQIKLVKERLDIIFKDKGYDLSVITIAEPELDDVVDENDDVELVLRFALQRRLLHNKYPPHYFLESSQTIILSDRSWYSSLSYQNEVNNELDPHYIETVNSFVSKPALIFYFDKKTDEDSLSDVKKNTLMSYPFPQYM